MATVTEIASSTFQRFVDGIVAALPSIMSGLLFLALAYVFVKVVTAILRSALDRAYPDDQRLVADFALIVVTALLWFGVALVFLKVVGMGDVAASFGTAAGFIALGVSYALSEMIEDAVAGVYLLRDPDFNLGYSVTVDGTTGTVTEIGLRKSRIELDSGATVVKANRKVESEWTKNVDGGQDG